MTTLEAVLGPAPVLRRDARPRSPRASATAHGLDLEPGGLAAEEMALAECSCARSTATDRLDAGRPWLRARPTIV